MHDFRRLEVWREGISVAAEVYRVTEALPKREVYGLTAQLRRASVSIASNIAEGAGKGSARDMARFLRNALGSIAEVETQLEICLRLELLNEQDGLLEVLNSLRRRVMTLHDRTLAMLDH